ncbi:hypothetical protein [Flavobacterium sp.]|uniref:hypothetical protein n=1 Tax=Flavobacterium sp. TaxID=239 RepID=UPI00286DDAB7|nr:hypothetical protein [Flavobacterium sp.]
MIQHIKNLLILILLICFSCKEKNVSKIIVKENATSIIAIKSEQKTKFFSFYKAFSFCENNVGYFTEQEARDLYVDKTITLDIEDEKKVSPSLSYTKEKLDCIYKNLDLSGIITTKYFKNEDVFPFDNIALVDNKYVVVARDGYFFVFIIQGENKKNPVLKDVTSYQGFESLLNHKLTGLSIIDEKAYDPYKKYGLDFSIVCMCDSPSLYINTTSKELIIFNYCDSNKSISNVENKSIFKIEKIENKGNKLIIIATPNLKITCEGEGEVPVFKMLVEGDFPKEYVGSDLKKVFTSVPEKFQKEDCGDFGG